MKTETETEMQTVGPGTASPAGGCARSPGRDASIDVSGDLDMYSAGALLELVQHAVRESGRRGCGRMEIRCTDLEFCDSSGLAALIRASRCAHEAGMTLELADCPPYLIRLLSLSGVDAMFETGDTRHPMHPTGEPCDLLSIDSTQADIAQARRAVDALLAHVCPAADRFSITLVLSELLTNAVQHATGRWLLRLRAQRGRIIVEMADDDPALPRLREPDLVNGSGGLGLHLVHALASRVEVEPHPQGRGKTIRALWITPIDSG